MADQVSVCWATLHSFLIGPRIEHYRRVVMVDPTNVDQDSLSVGFTVVFFSKRAKGALPDPVVGDVLVVRNIQVSHSQFCIICRCRLNPRAPQVAAPRNSGKLAGSCPSYKSWSWHIFHPQDGTTRGGGTDTSRLVPSPEENMYCIRLGDWWRELTNGRAATAALPEGVTAYQISAADVASRAGNGREHRLIKDASPHAPPRGYFDCTVEVTPIFLHRAIILQEFMSSHRSYTDT